MGGASPSNIIGENVSNGPRVMDPDESVNVILQVEEHGYSDLIAKMLMLLQNGFMVKVRTGLSVGQFFSVQLNLAPEYIAHRISTVFLDGKPVDDIDAALLRDNATLALSGAMPGLAGAVMQRGSIYASFRDTISYRDDEKNGISSPREEGMIRLKLFNLVMKDLGPGFLEKGIYLDSVGFIAFLAKQKFPQSCPAALVNGTAVKPGRLIEHPRLNSGAWVRFGIETIAP